MIPVYQIEILKKERDRVEFENRELFLALSNAILRLTTHTCKTVTLDEGSPTKDYWEEHYPSNER